jgi:hypothetical protein
LPLTVFHKSTAGHSEYRPYLSDVFSFYDGVASMMELVFVNSWVLEGLGMDVGIASFGLLGGVI